MAPPRPLADALRRDLAPGERVLWSAQPRGALLAAGLGIWLFAIPWTVFALFWESMAFLPWVTSTKSPDWTRWTFGIVMPLFGLPFVAIGLWMLWSPIRRMRKARDTLYALTDRRAIRIVGGRTTEQTSVFLDRIGPVELSRRADDWGTIRIQTHSRVDSEGDRTTERFEMAGVPEVSKAHRLIVERQPLG